MSKRNPSPEAHAEIAEVWIAGAKKLLGLARTELAQGDVKLSLVTAIDADLSAALAVHNAVDLGGHRVAQAAEHTRDQTSIFLKEALAANNVHMRLPPKFVTAGQISRPVKFNPNGRHPSGTPNFLIRTYSTSILSGNKDIYLVVNTRGQVMDAVITESEDFGPVAATEGYSKLPILELDISRPQYSKLIKLAKELEQVVVARPVYRAPRDGEIRSYIDRDRWRTAANPLEDKKKKRLMR